MIMQGGEKMNKKTHEDYVAELAIKNPNLEAVGEYIDAKTKFAHKCKKHLVVWDISPSNALKGQGCYLCRREKIYEKRAKSHEQYLADVSIKNPHVIVLGVYINATTPILHRCKYCGKEWDAYPGDILSGKACIECSCKRASEQKRKTHQQYVGELKDINNDIEPIEHYINTDTSILHRCKVCEHIWPIKPNHTLSGHGCPMCGFKANADAKRKSRDQYIQELSYVNPNIEVVGEYINFITPLLHRCKKCGNEWNAKPIHTMRGHGCTVCNESHGERGISRWLVDKNINNIPQCRFDDCRDKQPLPFDFYLPELNVAIEYQGRQHYESVEIFGGEKQLLIQKNNDNIKREYCKNNNIKLLEIPYWDFNNIERYIKNIISEV